jgi:hypothetical protein
MPYWILFEFQVLEFMCNTFASFKKYVIKPKWFLGYFERGNACALNILMHEQYLFDSLNQNNLAHVGKARYALPLQVWKYMLWSPMYFWDNL